MEGLFILLLLGPPIVISAGWVRWFRRKWYRVLISETSVIGLALATASVALVLLLFLLDSMRVVRLQDSSFTAICRSGFLFSLAAILCSMARSRRRNPLRWHTLFCAIGTLLFWIMLFGVQPSNAPTPGKFYESLGLSLNLNLTDS